MYLKVFNDWFSYRNYNSNGNNKTEDKVIVCLQPTVPVSTISLWIDKCGNEYYNKRKTISN